MGGFLAFLIQGLPFFGKVTEAFTNFTNKKMDTELQKYVVDGKVDTDVIDARVKLATVMSSDPATSIGRWFFIVPTGLYYTGCIWDSTGVFRGLFKLGMLELPGWLQYMPHAVVAYLFIMAWRGNAAGR